MKPNYDHCGRLQNHVDFGFNPSHDRQISILEPRARGYKTFFMLNSVEHEMILNAHKYKNSKKLSSF